MKYNGLKLTAKTSTKRVGRGISAGQGKTAGRGTKGQGSRAGSSRKPGFEGGQNPLMQRLPKLRGFKSHKQPVEIIYTGQLDKVGANIDNHRLAEARLISSPHTRVKLLHNGEVSKKISVKLQLASSGAIKTIEKAGGKFEKVDRIARLKTKTTKSDNA